jgi:protein-tyrosine phosphatase
MSENLDDRWVPLAGCYNFRDLGGYATSDGRRVRTGHLYRSDGLHHLTDDDVRHLRDVRGIRTVIDLRSANEVSVDGLGPLPRDPIALHHLPLFDNDGGSREGPMPDDLGELYFMMLRFARQRIASVLGVIATSPDPAVFHCAAGKDRTGVVGAVVLGILGVPDETIVDDYAFTSKNLEQIVARLNASESYKHIFHELPPTTLHAEGRTMSTFLARAHQRYGSMTEWAGYAGVTDETLEQLRKALLDPA